MDIRQFMKRKSISDSWKAENVSDKRLRIKVQTPQTNGLERVKSFVNVHCIVSSATWKGWAKFRRCLLWKNLCRRPWMHWFRSNSWVIKGGAICFNSFKPLKTISAKFVSFLNLYTKRSSQKALQFWRVVNSLKTRKSSKMNVLTFKREAPGICPVCAILNPALEQWWANSAHGPHMACHSAFSCPRKHSAKSPNLKYPPTRHSKR